MMLTLAQRLDPLIAQFNALHNVPRLVAPLSPTCPECLFGADAVRQVIAATPDLQALVVWLPMLAGDTPATTEQAAARFAHPRLHSFADPQRLVGRYLAGRLGGGDWIAWDCYLLYPPGVVWEHDLPLPDQWFHQLDNCCVDPSHQQCGPRLLSALLDGAQRLAQ